MTDAKQNKPPRNNGRAILISPEEALSQLAVKDRTEQKRITRIKAWMKFLGETEVKKRLVPGDTSNRQGGGTHNSEIKASKSPVIERAAGELH